MESKFNACLETKDWRYSASVYGLIEYLQYRRVEFEKKLDILEFNEEDVTEESFLLFAEAYYCDEFHHKAVEILLDSEQEFDEEKIKEINSRLSANVIMKKVFGKIKFDGNNGQQIKDIINQNRLLLIKETFRNKNNLYKNFCNTFQLFNDAQGICRLNGYYIDLVKKGKSIGYNFDISTFKGKDDRFFDFIPFAFSKGREAFFINDNSSIDNLFYTNRKLHIDIAKIIKENGKKSVNTRKIFFESIKNFSNFIDYDVEVIVKSIENDYFETLYLRRESIEILKKIENYDVFCFSYKVNDNYYIDIQKEVTDAIINLINVDKLIEFFLKVVNKDKTKDYEFLIYNLIKLNILIKDGKDMNKGMNSAYAAAKEVSKKLEDNKLNSYKTKLTSAIVFKDYSTFCNILLQLSNYTDVQFDFAYGLFENFEDNKELAYTFINTLRKS